MVHRQEEFGGRRGFERVHPRGDGRDNVVSESMGAVAATSANLMVRGVGKFVNVKLWER